MQASRQGPGGAAGGSQPTCCRLCILQRGRAGCALPKQRLLNRGVHCLLQKGRAGHVYPRLFQLYEARLPQGRARALSCRTGGRRSIAAHMTFSPWCHARQAAWLKLCRRNVPRPAEHAEPAGPYAGRPAAHQLPRAQLPGRDCADSHRLTRHPRCEWQTAGHELAEEGSGTHKGVGVAAPGEHNAAAPPVTAGAAAPRAGDGQAGGASERGAGAVGQCFF